MKVLCDTKFMEKTVISTVPKSVVTGLLIVPLVLMSLGDLRNEVTPLGYWVLWGIWAVATTVVLSPWRSHIVRQQPPLLILLSFGVLISGMVLSGLVNHDTASIYQAVKISVICGLFLVMWLMAVRLSPPQVLVAMYLAVAVSVLCFFVLALFGGHLENIEGRQGSIFAWFGSMWKAGAFFLPVFIADLIVRPKAWAINSFAIAACLFLVLLDGSRTGLLLIIAVLGASGVMLWWRRDLGPVLRRPKWVLLAACCLGGLFLINAAIKTQTSSRSVIVVAGVAKATEPVAPAPTPPPELGSTLGKFENVAESALAPLVKTRLGSGDDARVTLLRNGFMKVAACLPLGCGFGSTASEISTGASLYVHNAYLAASADFGMLGLIGMLGFLLCSILPLRLMLDRSAPSTQAYYVGGLAGSGLAYSATLALHTFTSEMSEWGYLVFALAFAWSFFRRCDG
ncbi:MAG: O-antigen ligase family protein [Burkholderiaceae bacterium]